MTRHMTELQYSASMDSLTLLRAWNILTSDLAMAERSLYTSLNIYTVESVKFCVCMHENEREGERD